MTKSTDFYAALGVSAASDEVVIRAAFKALMLKYHPDTNKSPDATARAAAINEAFSVLGDPVRRAAYDATRSDRAAPPASPPSPPPPPDKPATAAASSSHAPRIAAKAGWASRIGGMIAVVLIGGVVRVTLQNINSANHSPALASTSLGVEPAQADTSADNIDTAADNMDAMADATQPAGFGGNTQALASSPSARTETFTYQPPTSIDFKVIESAGNTFAKIINRKGLAGARAWSEDCHDKAQINPGWSEADRCAAFDYAASYMDQSMAKATNTSPNTYFAFEADNQADNYRTVGAMPFSVNDRLQHIRAAVEPVTYEAVMSIIHQKDQSSPVAPAIDRPIDEGVSNQTGG